MTKKTVTALLVAGFMGATMALVPSESFARRGQGPQGQGPHHGPHGPHQKGDRCMFFGNLELMKERLSLTNEQVDKISAINLKFRKIMLKHREDLAPQGIRLKRLLLEDNVDIGKVRAQLKAMYDIKLEIRVTMIEHRIAIEKVLTPKQRQKLKVERRMMRRGGPGRGPMPPPMGFMDDTMNDFDRDFAAAR